MYLWVILARIQLGTGRAWQTLLATSYDANQLKKRARNEGSEVHVDDVASNICSPRHTMPINSRNEGSEVRIDDVASNVWPAFGSGGGWASYWGTLARLVGRTVKAGWVLGGPTDRGRGRTDSRAAAEEEEEARGPNTAAAAAERGGGGGGARCNRRISTRTAEQTGRGPHSVAAVDRSRHRRGARTDRCWRTHPPHPCPLQGTSRRRQPWAASVTAPCRASRVRAAAAATLTPCMGK